MACKIYFDTETSGLKPGQIAQLSLIKEDNNDIKAYNYFFEIKYIDPDAEALLGRGLDFYKKHSNGLRFNDKADEIAMLFNNNTWIAHNIKFDENFISTEFWRCNKEVKPVGRFDTMLYYKDILKILNKFGRIKNPKLEEVINRLNINMELVKKYCIQLFGESDVDFHDARLDTTALFVISQFANEIHSNNLNGPWHEKFTLK